MAHHEGFAVILTFVLVAGVGTICCLQNVVSTDDCAYLAWILLLPAVVYYTRVMLYFHQHESKHHCEPPASAGSCILSIAGCLTLLAIAVLHTRLACYEISVLRERLAVQQRVGRAAAAGIAWACFAATLGHVECEKLAYSRIDKSATTNVDGYHYVDGRYKNLFRKIREDV